MPGLPSADDLLFKERLDLERTLLAFERTALAYVRTGLAFLVASAALVHVGGLRTLPVAVPLLLGAAMLFWRGWSRQHAMTALANRFSERERLLSASGVAPGSAHPADAH